MGREGHSRVPNHPNLWYQVETYLPVCAVCEISHKSCCPHHTEPPTTFHTVSCLLFMFWFWIHDVIKPRLLLLQCWEKALVMGEHPWLVVVRRQRSRFTLLIRSILCWRGVAKQPQGTEWDSNSGDLELQWAYWSPFLSCEGFAAYIWNYILMFWGLCALHTEAHATIDKE